ncbi:MAG: GNAT family N-acetyltransferase [Sneathiella sp.]
MLKDTGDKGSYLRKNDQNVLETERLVLTELKEENAAFILTLFTQPSFLKFIGARGVQDLQTARAYIVEMQAQYLKMGFGNVLVSLKESREPIGLSGFVKRETLPHVDIGFAYLPEFWGHGYAFEGAKALLHYGQFILEFPDIVAITNPRNIRSQKLLEKLGMKFDRLVQVRKEDEKAMLFTLN